MTKFLTLVPVKETLGEVSTEGSVPYYCSTGTTLDLRYSQKKL